jgi:hypothetical protein
METTVSYSESISCILSSYSIDTRHRTPFSANMFETLLLQRNFPQVKHNRVDEWDLYNTRRHRISQLSFTIYLYHPLKG